MLSVDQFQALEADLAEAAGGKVELIQGVAVAANTQVVYGKSAMEGLLLHMIVMWNLYHHGAITGAQGAYAVKPHQDDEDVDDDDDDDDVEVEKEEEHKEKPDIFIPDISWISADRDKCVRGPQVSSYKVEEGNILPNLVIEVDNFNDSTLRKVQHKINSFLRDECGAELVLLIDCKYKRTIVCNGQVDFSNGVVDVDNGYKVLDWSNHHVFDAGDFSRFGQDSKLKGLIIYQEYLLRRQELNEGLRKVEKGLKSVQDSARLKAREEFKRLQEESQALRSGLSGQLKAQYSAQYVKELVDEKVEELLRRKDEQIQRKVQALEEENARMKEDMRLKDEDMRLKDEENARMKEDMRLKDEDMRLKDEENARLKEDMRVKDEEIARLKEEIASLKRPLSDSSGDDDQDRHLTRRQKLQ